MRKKLIQVLFTVVAIILVIMVIDKIINSPERRLKKITALENFIITVDYCDSFQSYIEAIISNSNKRILTSRFKFEENMSKFKGKVEPDFITENSNYLYCYIEEGNGPYDYGLLAIEKEGNLLKLYEFYGN